MNSDRLRNRFIRAQTLVSVIINSAFSAAVAAAIGVKDLAVDFLPQTFMMILMGSLALTIVTRRAVASGKLQPTRRGSIGLPNNVFLRALSVAVGSTLLFGGPAFAIARLTGAGVPPLPELITLKVAFAVVVTALVTPFVIHSTLESGALKS